MKKTGICLIIILLCFFLLYKFSYPYWTSIIQNGGFESISGNSVHAWLHELVLDKPGVTGFTADETVKHSGLRSICITNHFPNAGRYIQEVRVKPNTLYKLSGWIRTEDVGLNGKGAYLSAGGEAIATRDINGTSAAWQYVEHFIKTGENARSLPVALVLGGYDSFNTGKAWFDDVVLVEETDIAWLKIYSHGIAIYIVLYITASGIIYYYLRKRSKATKKLKTDPFDKKIYLYILLGAGLMYRILTAFIIEGFPRDNMYFKLWSSVVTENFLNVYTIFNNGGVIVDADHYLNLNYPPVYMYVLFILGKLAEILGLYSIPWAYTLLLKIPAIAADIITSFILYKYAKKNINAEMGLFISGIYALNPAVLVNSLAWGQIDSFFTLFIVGALLLLSAGKTGHSAVMFAAAVLIKPQGIIFLPVLFFELVKRKSIKDFISAFLHGMITVFLLLLPFSFTQEPLWIFKLFSGTMSDFTSASLNAFNLFSLLGGNWVDDSSVLFILSYRTWGFVFIALTMAFVLFLYARGKTPVLPMISALVLISGVFLLSTRMHERYLFPSLALALLIFIYTRDRRVLFLFAAFSVTVCVNTYTVLFKTLIFNNGFIASGDILLISFSIANILIFVFLIKLSLNLAK